jgi:hypothetical protein
VSTVAINRPARTGMPFRSLLLLLMSAGYMLLCGRALDFDWNALALWALVGGFSSLLFAGACLIGGRWMPFWMQLTISPLVVVDLVFLGAVYLGAWAATVQHTMASPERVAAADHLKGLALAMRDYEEEHGEFPPPAIYGKDGEPLLSWRVLILPYLEREDLAEKGLFQRFRLDEAWDGPNNSKLLSRMPEIYAIPRRRVWAGPHATFFQVFVGPGAAFEAGRGHPLAEFTDGLDDTILIVEGGRGVPWTKPQDLAFAPDEPLPELGAASKASFFAVFADTSVRAIRNVAAESTVRALITRNAGDRPGPDW